MAIHVVARFTARPETVQALRVLMLSLVEPIRTDAGCLRCNLVTNVADPAEFTFIEEWRSQAAIDKHLQDPFIQAVVEKARPLLAGPLDLRQYETSFPPSAQAAGRARVSESREVP